MTIKATDVADLRKKTGAGMMDCKKALEESKGNIEKAIEYLRKKGAATSAKRAEKEAKEGFVAVYSHGGRIGSIVEVNCETDFVAKNADFQEFARDIAMQVAASAPKYLTKEDVPKETVEKEKKLEIEKAEKEGKPKDIAAKIAEGKLEKYYSEICLLSQPFIKETEKTVSDLLNEKLISIGENIIIARFERFEIGESK